MKLKVEEEILSNSSGEVENKSKSLKNSQEKKN
jgi:hypothetical protein